MEKNEETTDETAAELVPAPQLRYRIAFFVTALVVLGLVVTLPFSVKTVVDDVLGPATGRVIQLISQSGPPEPNHVNLHLAITSIDEVQLFATIRLSGHYVCAGCAWSHRVLLVAITSDDAEAAGLPPSAGITLPADDTEISQTVQLPVRGHPIHYPFDRYDLCLGVVYQRIYPDGTQETLSEAQARGHLFLSLQELLPRNTMRGPFPVDPHSIRSVGDPFAYATAFEMSFSRPPYLRFLTVLLVLLITAAAAYSVFLRPLHDLVVNAGALVLGVWGIRSILTPGNIFYITAIDLALSMVIIFLLGALTIRALMFVHDEAQMTLLRRHPHPTEGNGPPRTRSAR